MLHIGLKIRHLMDKENLDAAKLGKRLGKTKQAVYDMLAKEDLNTSVLRELSKIFNVPLTYFVSENLSPAEYKNRDLMMLCKSLVKNYQQRDEVMAQLVSMVSTEPQEENEEEENQD
jgi:hypothetical protein|nr:MAG TPA: LAMBDA REPRESSOR (TRIPLE MUTANT)/DNA COMPLEX-DNA COMPLEX, DOUBLE HELIX, TRANSCRIPTION-DNA.1A [Caudoviricetes sp.]